MTKPSILEQERQLGRDEARELYRYEAANMSDAMRFEAGVEAYHKARKDAPRRWVWFFIGAMVGSGGMLLGWIA